MKMTNESPVVCNPVEVKSNAEMLAREGFAHCYSTNATGEADVVYMFGGLVKKGVEDFRETNDLVTFRPSTGEVSVLTAGEECPNPRAGAALALAGDRLFMFGGFNHSDAWLNDLWVYQLPTGPWRKAEFSASRASLGGATEEPAAAAPLGTPIPTPRDKATLSAVVTASGTHLWLFGGFGPVPAGGIANEDEDVEDDVEDGGPEADKNNNGGEQQDPLRLTWFDDLYCINATPNQDGLYEVKKPMQLNLDSPTPRAAHGATCFVSKNGSHQLVIFGGRDTDGRTNDLAIFDTNSRKWTLYDMDNTEEEEDDDEDVESADEEEVDDEGVEEDDEEEESETKEVTNGNGVKDDIAEQVKKNLEAIRKRTTQAEMENKEKSESALMTQPWPEARSYASTCIIGNRWLFIFGGRNAADKDLNDLWMFDLENASNGWYQIESKAGPWVQARSGALFLPVGYTESDNSCKLLVVGGGADQQPESMHCMNLFQNAFTFNVNITAALAIERKPVADVSTIADAAAMLKAAKKSVMAALKGHDIGEEDCSDEGKPRKRGADVAEELVEDHANGNGDASKRVRCGADN